MTDQQGGETLDRIPVVPGEIRIADRAYLQPDRMAAVLDAGADLVVRAGWRNARWLDAAGEPVDLLAELRAGTASGLIDRPIWLGRQSGAPLRLRLVAVKKTAQATEAARRKAHQAARAGGHQISKGTLAAAEWVILITSLKPQAFRPPISPCIACAGALARQAPEESGRLEGTAGAATNALSAPTSWLIS
ncbi:MAG: hypothetical protein U1E33_03840 [Rhodospirillales bacterium]